MIFNFLLIKDNDINFYNNNKLKKEKSSDKFKDISLTKYNIDNCNNSKLNKTDANINLNTLYFFK